MTFPKPHINPSVEMLPLVTNFSYLEYSVYSQIRYEGFSIVILYLLCWFLCCLWASSFQSSTLCLQLTRKTGASGSSRVCRQCWTCTGSLRCWTIKYQGFLIISFYIIIWPNLGLWKQCLYIVALSFSLFFFFPIGFVYLFMTRLWKMSMH